MFDMLLINSQLDLGDLTSFDQLMRLIWIAITSVFSLSCIMRNQIRKLTQWIRTARDHLIRWVRHPSSNISPHDSGDENAPRYRHRTRVQHGDFRYLHRDQFCLSLRRYLSTYRRIAVPTYRRIAAFFFYHRTDVSPYRRIVVLQHIRPIVFASFPFIAQGYAHMPSGNGYPLSFLIILVDVAYQASICLSDRLPSREAYRSREAHRSRKA